MPFGRRNSDKVEGARSPSPILLAALIIAVALAIGAGAAVWALAPTTAAQSFEATAHELGITEATRESLGKALHAALRDMSEAPCDDGLHARAGRAAVAYYETLLEKPILAAGLNVTYDSFCTTLPTKDDHPLTPLLQRWQSGVAVELHAR